MERLEIVSISLDKDRKRFESFVRQKGMSWHHVMEGGGWSTRLARQYGVNSIPRMIVLDANGVVIADGVRGRRLDEVIQSSLGGIKRSPRPVEQREPAPSAGSEELRQDLATLREQLADIAIPLQEVGDQLRELEEQIAGLQPGAPAPSVPAGQRVGAVLEGLRSVRQALFMLGLVDEHNQVALPSNPLETLPPDDPQAPSRVAAMMDSARRSIQSMRELADGAGRERAALETRIRELEQEASGRRGVTPAIESRADKLRSETDALAERFGVWTDRIEAVGRMIAARGKPLAASAAALAELDQGLRSLARTADAAPRAPGPLLALRDAFNGVRRKLQDAALEARAGNAVALPSDPFEGRSLRDPEAIAELKVQLRIATEAAAALRELLAGERSRHESLAAEVEALRRQVTERLESGEVLEDLEQRFSEISLQALALPDPA